MSRDEIKLELKRLIKDLRSMTDEWEKLYNEIDGFSEEDFDDINNHIRDVYYDMVLNYFKLF